MASRTVVNPRALLVGPIVPKGAAGRRWFERELKRARRASDLIVAVDGGLDHCARHKIIPDLALGDWDSLKKKSLRDRVENVTLPVAKDRSDLYYALRELSRRGRPRELTCLGLAGGRPDHHLAVLLELSLFSQKGMAPGAEPPILRGPDAEYRFLAPGTEKLTLDRQKGRTVSLFAMSAGVGGLSLKGFRFELKEATLASSSRGLSNVISASHAIVTLRRGRLLVVLPSGLG